MAGKAIVNLLLFLAFALASLPQVTGISIHEWIGLLVLAPLTVHVLTDWSWIVQSCLKLVGRLGSMRRFNLIWDGLLFVNMAIVTLSGLEISEVVIPASQIAHEGDRFWTAVHDFSSNLMLALLGVHLALHWDWITLAMGRSFRGMQAGSSVRPRTTSPRRRTVTALQLKSILRVVFRIAVLALAAGFICGLFWPLQFTGWAGAIRAQPEEREMDSLSPTLRALAIGAKQAVTLIGPGLLTLGALRLISRRRVKNLNSDRD